MAEEIKYIETFWKNIKDYDTVESLKENFNYCFLNDMLDNHKKWKEDIELINNDLDLYFNKKKIFTSETEDIYMDYDNFVKLFLKSGNEFISKYETLKADDMKFIIQNAINEHIESLGIDYNASIDNVKQKVTLEESIKKPKILF